MINTSCHNSNSAVDSTYHTAWTRGNDRLMVHTRNEYIHYLHCMQVTCLVIEIHRYDVMYA